MSLTIPQHEIFTLAIGRETKMSKKTPTNMDLSLFFIISVNIPVSFPNEQTKINKTAPKGKHKIHLFHSYFSPNPTPLQT